MDGDSKDCIASNDYLTREAREASAEAWCDYSVPLLLEKMRHRWYAFKDLDNSRKLFEHYEREMAR